MTTEPVPWIVYEAQKYISALVRRDWKVFEWGAGDSTLYWGLHCGTVVSVEDDLNWFNVVNSKIKARGLTNCDLRLVPGEEPRLREHKDPDHPSNFFSAHVVGAFDHLNFKKYAQTISEFPDKYFDLVVVDGRARSSCLAYAPAKVKFGGYLLWDNSDYGPHIKHSRHLLNGWQQAEFRGNGDHEKRWATTVWRRWDKFREI